MSKVPASSPSQPYKFDDVASLFAALGDGTRLRLLTRLSTGGPMSIARLTYGESITRQAVTKHLQVLADSGLARSAHLGRETVWCVEPQTLQAARDCIDSISAQCFQALKRLKAFVEQ